MREREPREKSLDRERERDREFRDRKFGECELRDRELRDRDLRDHVDGGASFLIDESDIVREREYSSVLLSNFSDRIFEIDFPLEWERE